MVTEELLTITQLREIIFENRKNKISLMGIQEYFKRNEKHYKLEEVFQVISMILGALKLYHNDEITLNKL